jgi:hypothetical protein
MKRIVQKETEWKESRAFFATPSECGHTQTETFVRDNNGELIRFVSCLEACYSS